MSRVYPFYGHTLFVPPDKSHKPVMMCQARGDVLYCQMSTKEKSDLHKMRKLHRLDSSASITGKRRKSTGNKLIGGDWVNPLEDVFDKLQQNGKGDATGLYYAQKYVENGDVGMFEKGASVPTDQAAGGTAGTGGTGKYPACDCEKCNCDGCPDQQAASRGGAGSGAGGAGGAGGRDGKDDPCCCTLCFCELCKDPARQKGKPIQKKPCLCTKCKCVNCEKLDGKKQKENCKCKPVCLCEDCEDEIGSQAKDCMCAPCKCDPCTNTKAAESTEATMICLCVPCECEPCVTLSQLEDTSACSCKPCKCDPCESLAAKAKTKGCLCGSVCECEQCEYLPDAGKDTCKCSKCTCEDCRARKKIEKKCTCVAPCSCPTCCPTDGGAGGSGGSRQPFYGFVNSRCNILVNPIRHPNPMVIFMVRDAQQRTPPYNITYFTDKSRAQIDSGNDNLANGEPTIVQSFYLNQLSCEQSQSCSRFFRSGRKSGSTVSNNRSKTDQNYQFSKLLQRDSKEPRTPVRGSTETCLWPSCMMKSITTLEQIPQYRQRTKRKSSCPCPACIDQTWPCHCTKPCHCKKCEARKTSHPNAVNNSNSYKNMEEK